MHITQGKFVSQLQLHFMDAAVVIPVLPFPKRMHQVPPLERGWYGRVDLSTFPFRCRSYSEMSCSNMAVGVGVF
ncbi:hypothetical protein CEXT_696031 [Caerostris extrusa]|uniref:Uncharacterized protein n=1 Tax=Caerostris extrusa TaxID=172846 RepID=A0AAV4S226_CAEEX|nr:hypothetical protein CEXT_696031 [Caerostris extrusa]